MEQIVRDDDGQLQILTKHQSFALDATLPAPLTRPPQALVDALTNRPAAPGPGPGPGSGPELDWCDFEYLRRYQREALDFVLRARRVLLNIACGLGKTVVTAAALEAVRRTAGQLHALVVCPSSLKRTWRDEVAQWCAPSVAVRVIQKGRDLEDGAACAAADVLIVSYAMLATSGGHRSLRGRAWNMVVADEAHSLKHRTSLRAKAFSRVAARCAYCVLLSATPCERHDMLYNLLRILDPRLFATFYPPWNLSAGQVLAPPAHAFYFGQRYCRPEVKHTPAGRVLVFGASVRHRELALLCEPYVFSCSREQAQVNLPELQVRHLTIAQLSPAEAADDARRWARVEELTQDGQDAKTEISRIIRESAQTKARYVARHIATLPPPTEPTLIFFYHRCVMAAITAALEAAGHGFVAVCGDTTMKQRADRLARVQAGECHYAVLSLGTCSTGLNLQWSSCAFMAEMSFNSILVTQALYRIHRIGSTRACRVQYWTVDGSIDAIMLASNGRRKRTHEQLVHSTGCTRPRA